MSRLVALLLTLRWGLVCYSEAGVFDGAVSGRSRVRKGGGGVRSFVRRVHQLVLLKYFAWVSWLAYLCVIYPQVPGGELLRPIGYAFSLAVRQFLSDHGHFHQGRFVRGG